jgi:thiamine transport system permease protein
MNRWTSLALAVTLGVLFYLPYWPLLNQWQGWTVNAATIFDSYSMSFVQALTSTVLSLFFGCWVASGLLWLRSYFPPGYVSLAEYFALLPSFLPSLFVIIALLSVTPNFPFGWEGVVIMHTMSMMGFCGVLLVRTFDARWGSHSVVAQSLGASSWFFVRKMFPLVRKDLFLIFCILFSYFLTSISIPLMIGGYGMTSIEKIIYEQIFIHQNGALAIQFFFIQLLLLLPLFFFVQGYSDKDSTVEEPMCLLQSHYGLFLLFGPATVLLFGFFTRLPLGINQLFFYPEFYQSLSLVISGSLLLGFVCGGVTTLLLTALTFLTLDKRFHFLLRFLYVPSVTVLAFGFSRFSVGGLSALFFSALAVSIIFSPILFRLGLYQNTVRLAPQIESAFQMGAGSVFIFSRVVFPQVAHHVFLLSGLAAIWSMSDFAMTRLIVRDDWSLGLWIQSLVQQYRWDVALGACGLLMVFSFFVFFFFWRVSHVSRKKFM